MKIILIHDMLKLFSNKLISNKLISIRPISNKLIYLINPPLNDFYSKYPNDYAFPPLGIINLGTTIKNQTDWEVKLFDAQLQSLEYISEKMNQEKPSVVGLSVLAETYAPSLILAGLAKKNGSIVVFGNDQAALLGKNILQKRSEVDVICQSEHGEYMLIAFLKALEKNKFDEVPEMIYRNENNEIIQTNVASPKLDGKYKLDIFGVPDRSLLPMDLWKIYQKNYENTYGFLHQHLEHKVTGVTTINRGRGCPRAKNRCVYCGIMDLSIKVSSPNIFWEDVKKANEQIGANVFYEVFDSMSSVPWWIRELVESKPDGMDCKFIVYAQAKEVNPKIVDLYKRLGVIMVNMGLDSGDDLMLKRLKSVTDSMDANINAVKLINEAGMYVFCSFVLGAPGETKESLQNTINFAKYLADNKLAAAIEAQPLMPRVKSKIGDWFSNPSKAKFEMQALGLQLKNLDQFIPVSKSWLNEDFVDTPFVSRVYANSFCNVSYDELVEAANEIVSYAKNKGIGAGSVGIKIDN